MKQRFISVISIIGFVAVVGLIGGCSTTATRNDASAGLPGKTALAPGEAAPAAGAQLWSQNCVHCHNLRSPSSYSDAQWEIVALHMRVRANLTAEEHKKILAFLKSAH